MEQSQTQRVILLTMALFAAHPLALGAWFAMIPHVQANLGLDKAQLALALLGLPVATVPSLQIASRLVSRFGPRRIFIVMFPIQSVMVQLMLAATGQGTLFLALMAFGVALAFLQVSLNVYAGRLEKQAGVFVMNRCHGFWALGLAVGSALVGVMAALPDTTILASVAGASGLAGAFVAYLLPKLVSDAGHQAPPRRALGNLPPALIAISVFALVISMTEGAMADWAAIYLAERLPAGATGAGVAVSIYATFLALGRFLGDALKKMVGAVALARSTLSLAIVGLGLLVLPLPLPLAYCGFALIGLGASVGYPLGVSAVAALDDRYEGANIAIMSMIALSGFLIGPPLIGFLAESFSLRTGLAALLPGLGLSLWLAGALRR